MIDWGLAQPVPRRDVAEIGLDNEFVKRAPEWEAQLEDLTRYFVWGDGTWCFWLGSFR